MIEKTKDMAIPKEKAESRCFELGNNFVEHMEEIFENPTIECIDHWLGEMKGWYKQVSRLVFKHNKKQIDDDTLREWFFKVGSEPEIIFKDNLEWADLYEQFYEDILKTKDVYKSFDEIIKPYLNKKEK